MSLIVEVLVELPQWSALPDIDRFMHAAVAAAAAASGVTSNTGAEVSVLFTSDGRIRELNSAFRGIDKPTNVLSFPAPADSLPGAPLGDIALAFETTAREAAEEDKSLGDHAAHLLIHGFLHLVGYDHDDDESADAMEELERRALASMRIADPYRASEPERRVLP